MRYYNILIQNKLATTTNKILYPLFEQKFFLRCLKTGRGMMFLCPKNNNCDITKETRSHCQRCRYQRCIELSMYKPGEYR